MPVLAKRARTATVAPMPINAQIIHDGKYEPSMFRRDLLVSWSDDFLIHGVTGLTVVLRQKLRCGGIACGGRSGGRKRQQSQRCASDRQSCRADLAGGIHARAPRLLMYQESNARDQRT